MDTWHNKQWIENKDIVRNVTWGLKYDFYNGENNINNVNASTSQNWVNASHDSSVYQAQANLVRHVVQSLGQHHNLVWEVANEAMDHQGDYARWQAQLADLITQTELQADLPRHLVIPRDIVDHEHTPGHWDDPITQVHAELTATFNTSVSPTLADNDCCFDPDTPTYRLQRAWAVLTAGAQADCLDDALRNLTALSSADAQAGMAFVGNTRAFLDNTQIPFSMRGMHPADHLIDNGWCLARTPSGNDPASWPTTETFIVFLVAGGSTSFDANVVPASGTCRALWFNARNAKFIATNATLSAGRSVFSAPSTDTEWILLVQNH
eukprot:m.260353 g.260353  ORF g.260353 m.260353 type:complete len:323 (-) comp19678_c0_seq8:243-1211(-)